MVIILLSRVTSIADQLNVDFALIHKEVVVDRVLKLGSK
jgi:phosphoribosylpyrophosphate synthetase